MFVRKFSSLVTPWGNPPHWGDDRRPQRRIFIFILVLVCGVSFLLAGDDPQKVLLTLSGLGLVAVTVARWVVDGSPLPALSAVLTPGLHAETIGD